ncbi:MAG TPA: AraC family transcriptional regulator [Noviherbaspirillum sp.]
MTHQAIPDHVAGTVSGPYVLPVLEAAEARGVALRDLARDAGMAEDGLSPLPETITVHDYVRLLEAGARLANDPHFGLHAGECVKLGTYNVYGMILLSCRDFGQALQQTMRFEGLAHELGKTSLHVDGDVAEYRWHGRVQGATPHLVECVFAGIQIVANWLAGRTLPPAHVTFAHEAPADISEHRRIFGEHVRFGGDGNWARFDAQLLSWPVRNGDVSLYPVLLQYAEQRLQEKMRAQQEGDVVAQVRAAIVRNLAKDTVRLSLIAEELNITQRTLQRKLKDAGFTFQHLLDKTRHALAEDYLRQDKLSLAEIAFMLGYQEQSSFCHAFKEWTGVNPGAYRGRSGEQSGQKNPARA